MEEKLQQITKETVSNLLQAGNLELGCTQTGICIPIINRLYRKMLVGIKFPAIQVAEGIIIDGHHRYIASLLANFNLERVPANTSCATTVTDWGSVELVDAEWDTPAKIRRWDKHDKRYNGIDSGSVSKSLK